MAAITGDALGRCMAIAQLLRSKKNLAAMRIFAEKSQSQCRFARGHGTGDSDNVSGTG